MVSDKGPWNDPDIMKVALTIPSHSVFISSYKILKILKHHHVIARWSETMITNGQTKSSFHLSVRKQILRGLLEMMFNIHFSLLFRKK